MKKKIYIILAFFFLLNSNKNLFAFNESVLKTDHFLIKYHINETPYAYKIGMLAENLYENITLFLEYAPEKRITLTIETTGKIPHLINDNIVFYSDRDFNKTKKYLYLQIFKFFLTSLELSAKINSYTYPVSESLFESAFAQYSYTQFDTADELILKDYFINISEQHISYDKNIKSETQTIASLTGFFFYIEKTFGKQILLRAVKDAKYYGNFFISLSAITGVNTDEMKNNYNIFLKNRFSGSGEIYSKQLISDDSNPEFLLKDFSSSSDGDTFAYLKFSGSSYIIDIDQKKNKSKKQIILTDKTELNQIVFISNDTFAAAGNTLNGSTIYIYNIYRSLPENKIHLPFIYINKIQNYSSGNKLLINATCGADNCLIILDLNGRVIKKITPEYLSSKSEILSFDDTIYYSSKHETNDIRAINISSGDELVVYKDVNMISSISLKNANLLISTNNNSGGRIIKYDKESADSKIIFTTYGPIYKAVINNSDISFMTIFKGKYRITTYDLVH